MKARSRKTNDGGKKRGERREVCGGGAERKKWVEERESRIENNVYISSSNDASERDAPSVTMMRLKS